MAWQFRQAWASVAALMSLLALPLGAAFGAGEGSTLPDEEMIVSDADRAFWSFQPLADPSPPAWGEATTPENPIDAFIFQALGTAELQPNGEAAARTLVRRLYYDLIGLPPTPEVLAAFEADPSPEAYEALVDELLESEHFGERWARHWLDVARYADSDGYEFDNERPNAYPYRDFVIRALNRDMPYDQFIKWQIAGDEYAPDDPEALAATGFLAAGPLIDNQENEQNFYDELDDMVSTVGSAVLGLTVGCARCHDHMYDPIPAKDYFRMLGAFRSMKRYEALMAPRAEAEAFERGLRQWEADVAVARKAFEAYTNPLRDAARRNAIEALPVSAAEKLILLAPKDDKNEGQRVLLERFKKELELTEGQIRRALPEDQRAEWERLQSAMIALDKEKPVRPQVVYAVTDAQNVPKENPYLFRGNVNAKKEELGLGFLSVLPGHDSPRFQPEAYKPARAATTFQRTALAEWLTHVDEGAGRLTARVIVNRLWLYHFGQGIVRTPNDFGTQGERPSHPELLDYLAQELVRQDWQLKPLHRMIVTSAAYRQSAQWDGEKAAKDPGNYLVWRKAPQRLEGEIIRDAMLAVSGVLNPAMFGPGVFPYMHPAAIATGSTGKWPSDVTDGPETWRRSVYVFARRSVRMPFFEAFDQPDTVLSCGRRMVTTIPSQALALMNSRFVSEQAAHFAKRVLDEAGPTPEAWIPHAWELALGRAPRENEVARVQRFLGQQEESRHLLAAASEAEGAPAKDPAFEAVVDVCQVLLSLNEFIYID